MRITDEILMAFADGELDETARRAVEQAMRQDPSIAARVRQHQALRAEVFDAYAPALDEAVPRRLRAAAQPGKVVHLSTVRAARAEALEAAAAEADDKSGRRRWSWPEWGAIAATLVVGVLAGSVGWPGARDGDRLASLETQDGTLTARGALADALSQQLAGAARADGGLRVGVSFVARDGNYCRSFMTGAAAGLACRAGGEWKIPVMADSQAGGETPLAVLEAIDQRIAGKALDRAQEQAAQQRGWKP